MSERTESIVTCDQCGDEVTRQGRLGKSPERWVHVSRWEDGNSKFTDFCSDECLVRHFSGSPPLDCPPVTEAPWPFSWSAYNPAVKCLRSHMFLWVFGEGSSGVVVELRSGASWRPECTADELENEGYAVSLALAEAIAEIAAYPKAVAAILKEAGISSEDGYAAGYARGLVQGALNAAD